MDLKKVRVVISIILFFVIVITAFYIYYHKDSLFTSTYKIQYPDRCEEIFKDDVLITEECTNGRLIMEQQEKDRHNLSKQPSGLNREWMNNLT